MNKLIFKYFIYDLGLNVLFDSLIKTFGLLNLTKLDMYHISHNITNFLVKKYGFTNEMLYTNNSSLLNKFIDTLSYDQLNELNSDIDGFKPYLNAIHSYELNHKEKLYE